MHGPFQHPGINRHLIRIAGGGFLHIDPASIPKAEGFSQVYQCLACRTYYGRDSRLPNMRPFPEVTGRYLDCSTWNCPNCKCHQNSLDTQSFLGNTGGGRLRLLTEDDIVRELILHTCDQYGHDTYFG